MEHPVGNLHFKGVDGTDDIRIDQLCFIDKRLESGLDWFSDVGQVLLDGQNQIFRSQIGSSDDGDSRFQLFIEVLFVAGSCAA